MIDHDHLNEAIFEIRADEKRGTGFAVLPGHVITALHVVRGAATLTVCSARGELSATVVEGATDEVADFALLHVPNLEAKYLPIAALRPSDVIAGSHLRFEARGFPYGEKERALSGRVNRVAMDRLDLFSDELAAAQPEKPTGYSGGPVVVNDRVVGIVRKCLLGDVGAAGGTFEACPIGQVLSNQACAELLDENRLAHARAEAEQPLKHLLRIDRDVVAALSRALGLAEGKDFENVDEIASRLVAGSASKTIDLLQRVVRSFRRTGRIHQVRSVIRDLFAHLLPLFDECRGSIVRLRSQLANAERATTEAATLAYAEVLMAGADERPCAFVLRPGGLASSAMVPLAPEGGIDLDGTRFVQEVIDHLGSELFVKKSPGEIEGALRSIRAAGDPDYPPYFVALREADYRANQGNVDALLSTLKSLRLILLTGDDGQAEDQTFLIHPVVRLYSEDQRASQDRSTGE